MEDYREEQPIWCYICKAQQTDKNGHYFHMALPTCVKVPQSHYITSYYYLCRTCCSRKRCALWERCNNKIQYLKGHMRRLSAILKDLNSCLDNMNSEEKSYIFDSIIFQMKREPLPRSEAFWTLVQHAVIELKARKGGDIRWGNMD